MVFKSLLDYIYNHAKTTVEDPKNMSTDRLFLWCLKTVNSGLKLIIKDREIDDQSASQHSAMAKRFEKNAIDTVQLENALVLQLEKPHSLPEAPVEMSLYSLFQIADDGIVTPDLFIKDALEVPSPRIFAALNACRSNANDAFAADSSVGAPGSGGATMPSGGATVPSGGATVPGDGATMPSGGATVPDNGATMPSGGATMPSGGATVPGDGATVPDEPPSSEVNIPASLDWHIEDTILGLYEVLPVKRDSGKAFYAGGFGKVYRVFHKTWRTKLAMKQPHAAQFQTEAQKQVFIRECEAWVGLGLHPHIVSCYYVRDIGGVPAVFAEWMDGGSLLDAIESEWLYGGEPLQVMMRILGIAIQFARGLHYAHENGLIHQDVKPENLMLTKDGSAKVSDFGIARARGIASAETASDDGGTILAKSGGYTPAYCSPEQQTGAKLTRRTDIWSWAVSVLEMFVGERIWTSGIAAGLECDFYLDDARISPPKEMADLLHHCFKENEAERPHDFAEIEEALLKIFEAQAGRPFWQERPNAVADTADSLNNKALSYLDIGRPDEAEKCWKRAIALDPNHAESVYNQTLYSIRNTGTAKAAALARAEKLAQRNTGWKSQYFAAKIYMEFEEYQQALPLLERASADPASDSNVWDTLSFCKRPHRANNMIMHASGKPDSMPSGSGKICGHVHIVFNEDATHCLTVDAFSPVIRRWAVDTAQVIQAYRGHTDGIRAIAVSRDDKLLASAGEDTTLRIWDMQSGQCTVVIHMPSPPQKLVISPQNRYVLAQCSQNVDLYDLHQKNVIRLYDGEDDIREMRMDGPEAWIYIRTRRTALAWQLIDGKAFQTEAPGLPDTDRSPNSQDGRYALKIIDNNTLALWDIGTNQSIREYASTSSKIFKVYFDANDEYVVARCSGHRMPFYRIWEKDTGRLAAAFENDGAPDILIRGARRFVKYYKHPHTVLFDLKSKKQLLAWRDIGKTTIFRNDGKTYVSYGLGPDFWHYSLFELPDFDRLFEWALCEIRPS